METGQVTALPRLVRSNWLLSFVMPCDTCLPIILATLEALANLKHSSCSHLSVHSHTHGTNTHPNEHACTHILPTYGPVAGDYTIEKVFTDTHRPLPHPHKSRFQVKQLVQRRLLYGQLTVGVLHCLQ